MTHKSKIFNTGNSPDALRFAMPVRDEDGPQAAPPSPIQPVSMTRIRTAYQDGQYYPITGIHGTDPISWSELSLSGVRLPADIREFWVWHRLPRPDIFQGSLEAIRPRGGFPSGSHFATLSENMPGATMGEIMTALGSAERECGGRLPEPDHGFALDWHREMLSRLILAWNLVDGHGTLLPVAKPWIKRLPEGVMTAITVHLLVPNADVCLPPQI